MWPTPKIAFLLLSAHSLLVSGSPVDAEAVDAAVLAKRQCPQIHVFGARETTVSPGYGTAGQVVNLILGAYSGATSEAIVYPACGGQASCGGVQYGDSARQGTNAVASAVNSFNQRCPNAQMVLVGYSQGGQIMDNAVCGGPDTGAGITSTASPISAAALGQIKAVIEMGSPRYVAGLSYNVGTCTAQGFAPRPPGYVCGSNSASKIQSYCDAADPYCCTGSDQATHQGYGTKYGQAALNFVKSKLNSSSGGGGGQVTTPSTPTPTGGNTGSGGGSCSSLWGQCGGQGWAGPTCCSQGTCKAANQWYSQCLN
ncbi:carbohydrate esterase [Parachaetomium inaequale]|uniref:Carbohydrate esterase n=1 Tax=Parachaetomium inaequale TaxID=2588326 RepID=A0AAN6P6R6_9PEZI|nr:carbohydrate esterase [Parachaetomium inaequale]